MSKRKRVAVDENPRPVSMMRAESNQHSGHTHSQVDAFSPPPDSFSQLSSVQNFSALQAHNVAHSQAHGDGRNGTAVNTPSTTSASDTAAAALASYQMSLPQSADTLFSSHNGHDTSGVHPGTQEIAFGFALDSKMDAQSGADDQMPPQQMMVPTTPAIHPAHSQAVSEASSVLQTPNSATIPLKEKPPVGSEAWHKLRRDNHKEVERRRRETINEGINELAKIVPGSEKNKGSILQRAVQHITQLKDNESQNVEKWTLEKLLTEQAISELSATVDDLKGKLNEAWGEIERLKNVCEKAGIDPNAKDSKSGGR